jgi:hypothetical protein
MDYSEITRARMWSDVDQAHALYTDMRQNDPVSLIRNRGVQTLLGCQQARGYRRDRTSAREVFKYPKLSSHTQER